MSGAGRETLAHTDVTDMIASVSRLFGVDRTFEPCA